MIKAEIEQRQKAINIGEIKCIKIKKKKHSLSNISTTPWYHCITQNLHSLNSFKLGLM